MDTETVEALDGCAAIVVDETSPLLAVVKVAPCPRYDQGVSPHILSEFDPNGDPDNPQDWTPSFKWGIVAMLAFMAFCTGFTCISVSTIASSIVADLDSSSPAPASPLRSSSPSSPPTSPSSSSSSAAALLVTIWELGESAGPLLIAPLSEIFGRYPVINVANCLFVAATCLTALSATTPALIAMRCLTGLAVTANVLNPAIVGDTFPPEQRGAAMSICTFAQLLGCAVGPAVCGAVSEALGGWRPVIWLCAVQAAVCEALFLGWFRETYKVAVLRKRAARQRRLLLGAEHGRGRVVAGVKLAGRHVERRYQFGRLLESVLRPAAVVFGSGVLLAACVSGSLGYAYFYVMSVTLPDILQGIYGLSPSAAGASFLCFSGLGGFLAVIVCNLTLDRIYIRLRDSRGRGVGKPEYRLPVAVAAYLVMPIAMAIFGWAVEYRVPLPTLLASMVFLGSTTQPTVLPMIAYVVDAFGIYSASALTGMIIARCLISTFLPLSAAPLINALGYGWAFTVLGAFSLCFAPIPILLMKYGPRLRRRSEYTKEM